MRIIASPFSEGRDIPACLPHSGTAYWLASLEMGGRHRRVIQTYGIRHVSIMHSPRAVARRRLGWDFGGWQAESPSVAGLGGGSVVFLLQSIGISEQAKMGCSWGL